MDTSTNLKSASNYGFCRNAEGSVHDLRQPVIGAFFMPSLQVQLVPTPAHHNGRLRDYSTKVKMTDRIYTGDLIQDDKETFKLHLLKPYAFEGVGGFCITPKDTSRALSPTIRGGFIKRCRFL